MKDIIREYFKIMLEQDIDLEAAEDNLLDIIEEIKQEF